MEVSQMSEVDLEERKAELDRIGLALRKGIEREIAKRTRRRRVLTGAVLLVVLGLATVTGVTRIGSNAAPPAAAQVLEEAARAAAINPNQIPPGRFLYAEELRSYTNTTADPRSHLAYRWGFHYSIEQWVARDLSGYLRFTPLIGPDFPTAKDRANWEASGRPELLKPQLPSGREGNVPPGWFFGLRMYTAEDFRFIRGVLRAYRLSARELLDLSRSQTRFDRVVRGRVRAVTAELSRKGTPSHRIERDADRATFSLVLELISNTRGGHSSRLQAALLRLAASLHSITVDLHFKDRLGRPGIAVKAPFPPILKRGFGWNLIAFDPETFVVTEIQSTTRVTPGPGENLEPRAQSVEDFRYELVDHLRERPSGATEGGR
jgi:hypothetical protein